MPPTLLPRLRRLISAACFLFLAAGAWFGLVAARYRPAPPPPRPSFPVQEVLARVSAELVAARFRADTLYREARRADVGRADAVSRQMIAEGRLSQEKAACGSW